MHSHSHGPQPRAPAIIQRRLAVAVIPFVVATVVGLLVLWPTEEVEGSLAGGAAPERFEGEVVGTDPGACEAPPGTGFVCSVIEIRIESGPDEGTTFLFNEAQPEDGRQLQTGDDVIVARNPQAAGAGDEDASQYFFVDYQRKTPLLILTALFALVVIALSRWRGLTSLLGLAISLVILISFVIPAILEGSNPLAVSIVGSAAIMFVALYLAHGLNVRTTTAVLGTLASLTLTGILAVLFVEFARFTGLSSEEAAFLQVSADQINLEGLLLGGVIIGTLGVLDDVTVTQASAVWELRVAQPQYRFMELYRAGVRIGRDHIASTVNTLVLAYAGASLPLLILFTLSNRSLGDVLTTEIIAEELVRTFVGSIGLVAAVPITTGLTALVVSRPHRAEPASADRRPTARRDQEDRRREEGAGRSRFERDWFGPHRDEPESDGPT